VRKGSGSETMGLFRIKQ